jgi:hypothetical protein
MDSFLVRKFSVAANSKTSRKLTLYKVTTGGEIDMRKHFKPPIKVAVLLMACSLSPSEYYDIGFKICSWDGCRTSYYFASSCVCVCVFVCRASSLPSDLPNV